MGELQRGQITIFGIAEITKQITKKYYGKLQQIINWCFPMVMQPKRLSCLTKWGPSLLRCLGFLLLPLFLGDFLGMVGVLVGVGQDLHVVLPKVEHGRSVGSNGSA